DEVAEGRVDFSGASETSPSREHVEAPFLQLVLERVWAEEQATGSSELRLATFSRLGGAEPIVREHVHGTLERLPAAEPGAGGRARRAFRRRGDSRLRARPAEHGPLAGTSRACSRAGGAGACAPPLGPVSEPGASASRGRARARHADGGRAAFEHARDARTAC